MGTSTPPRVVITGMGAITPLGHTVPDTWAALLAGQSGIAPITRFDPSELRTRFGGEVKDFVPEMYMERKEARRLDRFIQFALVATAEALRDAGLVLDNEDPMRIGVVIGSGIGGFQSFEENVRTAVSKGLMRVSPFFIPNILVDSAAGRVAIEYNLHGPNFAVVNACASGTAACGQAFELLRRGDADVVVTGGADAAIMPLAMAGFDVMGAFSQRNHDPAGSCRPFAVDRDGFVMSEGSAILIMETLEHAQARGARIYAEVIGSGESADAYHMSAPHTQGRGAVDAMRMALNKARAYGVQPAAVDYINAHGTATHLNDVGETLAIKQIFGDHAYQVKISSTKSMLGHLLGGAGAIEAIVCAKTIGEGIIPPTINLHDPDPACDLDYTPLVARKADVQVTLSNSFGFGGHNACLLLRRYSADGTK
ncbi:MAG: beta-ketoacyl-[acyl-carrier-protein] synthase II [Caldilinea sp. CFX5]|nr:beta-ketoacyl-[acyl-carrier-protein] synthase II [Caldilinea sp. CFX5]